MTTRAEDVLYAALTETDEIERLAKAKLALECVPTAEMRPVVAWGLDRFFESGRTKAPSRAAMLSVWGQVIEDAEVELLDADFETDSILWAIQELRDRYADRMFQTFLKDAAVAMAEAAPDTKAATLSAQASAMVMLSAQVRDRTHEATDMEAAFGARLNAYQARAQQGHTTMGMTFGLEEIDNHTYGIHPGELAVLAGGPKVGKSYLTIHVALNEWTRGRRTTLVTLENSVDMTLDRLACVRLGISPRDWQRGLCTDAQVEEVQTFIHEIIPAMPGSLEVVMPKRDQRTMQMIVRDAQLRGTESLLIDQLTFVEHPSPDRKPRWEIIRDILHDLKTEITAGTDQMSALLAHQINREGVKASEKNDRVEMYHMAEGSEVERTADWVFALTRNRAMRIGDRAVFQTLASRREDIKDWDIAWRLNVGQVGVMNEVPR